MIVGSAGTRTWDTLACISVQANVVVGHCSLMPEVHDHSVVFLVSTCSDDEEELSFGLRSGAAVVICWIAISSPKDVSTIFRYDDVASFPAENGVPALTSADQVILVPAPDRVFSWASIQLVRAIFSKDVIVASSPVD